MTDNEALQVAELVNRHGIDQLTASHMIWGEGAPRAEAPPAVWSQWIRLYVDRLFAPLRKAVGLR